MLGVAFLFLWLQRGRKRNSTLILSSAFCLFVGIGLLRLEIGEQGVSPLNDRVGDTGIFEGIVVREPDLRESSQHLYIRETETNALFLVTTNPYEEIEYGDKVSVQGTLTVPEAFETDTGRTFDYRGYLKAKGVSEMISFGRVHVLETGLSNPVMSTLLSIKHTFMNEIGRAHV